MHREKDPEKEELRARLEELENRMSSEQQSPAITVMTRWHYLKSPISWRQSICRRVVDSPLPICHWHRTGETASERKVVSSGRNGKAIAFPVRQVSGQVVSALAQPMSDSTFPLRICQGEELSIPNRYRDCLADG